MMCLLALAGVMAGCTNDGSSELQRPETTVRLTAELQQGSRTVLGDDGLKVLWENQDRLGVFSDKGDANVSFLLSEGAGESVGRFEGALSKGACPAVRLLSLFGRRGNVDRDAGRDRRRGTDTKRYDGIDRRQ